MKKALILLMSTILISIGFSGTTLAKDKKTEIAYVEWSSATAASNVVKAVLEEKMGYDCELTSVSAAAMWQATASGDVDGFVCAWLPTLHQHYYKRVQDKVIDLGPNLVGTKIGLVVPTYVTIDSIDQLNAHAKKFDGKIIGIDPGAGIMSTTEKAIEDYNLNDLTLMEGAGAMMTAVLKDSIKNNEWVVVTGWTPHWMFARFDLKYLDDPKNVYGGSENIATVVRKNLKADDPDLYAFLDNFKWETEDINQVMDWIEDGATPEEAAKRFVRENDARVESWLPK